MSYKQQIIDLWRTCFDESEAFTELFFSRAYKDAHALVLESNEQVVSALHMLPYTMTYCGTEIPVSYIYGACTSPLHRRQKLMEKLLHQSFDLMKQQGVALTVLIPSEPRLFDYYRRMGYCEAFDYTLSVYSRPDSLVQAGGLSVASSGSATAEQLYTYFNRKLRERPCCLLHTADDFGVVCQDLQISGGQLLVAFNSDNIAGMAFAFPNKKGSYVSELLYDSEQAKELLLQEAATIFGNDSTFYRALPSLPDTTRLGMAKIIDPHRMMQLYADTHPHAISLKEMEQMDSNSLTQFLLDYPNREAYMSLMMD